MKTLKYSLLTLFLFAVLGSHNIFGEELSKNLHEEFATKENTLFEIENKYGDVEIQNWEQNKIQIDVEIKVDHPDEDKAKDLLDLITVEFSSFGNTISAKTEISERFSKIYWSFNDRKKFEINYKIMMPSNIQLKLTNKYGDAFVNEVLGHAEINIKYGSIKINKILRGNEKPFSSIDLSYSDGSIEECKWLKVDLSYSKLEIENSKAIIAVTKYSKLYIDNASSIVSNSKYDTYRIGKIANFVGDASYTDFDFDEVYKKFDLENRYGSCYIDFVPAGFDEISIDNEYASIRIGIEPNASYRIRGEAKYADIKYPDTGRVSRIKETSRTSVKGIVGKDKETKSTVEIETRYGSVKLY